MSKYPAKVALLKAGLPCPIGYVYTAEALKRAADCDERMSFDGDTLWYHNVLDEADEERAFCKVGIGPWRRG